MRHSPVHAIAVIAFSALTFACSESSDTVAPRAAAPGAVAPGSKLSARHARTAGSKPLSYSPGLTMRATSAMVGGIVVSDSATGAVNATALAQILVGAGVTVSNAQYTGAKSSVGTFTSDPATVGINSGVVLSTGIAKGVVGPNTLTYYGTDQGRAGDAQLTALVGSATFDATILEFDFVPDSSTVYINKYVFASDEYNEFVGSPFNDGVAIFVNGINCALVDGQPVSINSINDGYNDGIDVTPPSHPWLYRNNAGFADGEGNVVPGTAPINTEMDGLTTVLTCAAPVNKGVTNHIRIAIADANDGYFDSSVFIGAGSLTTTAPLVAVAGYTVQPNCVTGGGSVTLNASGSLHSAAITKFEWYSNGVLIGTGATFTWQAPAGTSPVTLRVTDALGATSETSFVVTVPAAGTPTATLTATPNSLTPVNGQYVPITVNAAVQGACGGPAPAYTISVTSDQEDDAAGTSDGATTADIVVVRPDGSRVVSSNTVTSVPFNPRTDRLLLRAERDALISGPRTYTLTLRIGGVAYASYRVTVPAPTNATCTKKNGKGTKDDRDDKNDKNGGAKNCNNGDRRLKNN